MQEGDRNELSLELSQAMNKWLKNSQRAMVIIDGVVTAVNDNFTCDITVQGVPYTNVPICVKIGTQASLYPIPVVNTACLVTWRDGNRGLPQIINFDQVDKYYIKVGQLFIDADKTTFNGGSNDGMVLLNPLLSAINDLQNIVNDLISKYNSHTHILTLSSGTGTAAPTTTQETGVLTPTQKSDIENTKITQ